MLQWKDMFPLNLFSLPAMTSFKISIVLSGFTSINFALPTSAEMSKLKLYSQSSLLPQQLFPRADPDRT